MHVPIDERVARWLEQADGDLAAVDLLIDRLPHLACFHAQQAGEKALKALVTRLTGDVPATHAVGTLLRGLDALGDAAPADVAAAARSLDKFYVPTRYPDALDFGDAIAAYRKRDADDARESAAAVIAWVNARLAAARAADPDPP